MLEMRDVREQTITQYSSIYETHIKQFEDLPISFVDLKLVREWAANLNVSSRTARGIICVFRLIVQEAIYEGEVKNNPLNNIRLPKLDKYEPKPFSFEETQLLISNAEGWFKNFLGFLFLTGMRIGEVCSLDWDDIKDDYIIVSKSMSNGVEGKTKTGNARNVPVFNDLRPFIEAQKEITQSGRIFPKAKGAHHMRYYWQTLTKKCGMEGRIMYNARHTFAIRALDSNRFKVSFVAQMLGHSSTQMLFNKYAKFIKSEKNDIDLNFSVLDTI
jgi:integrase